MRITEGKLRKIIREEAKRVLKEGATMSVEDVYSALRSMAPGPDMLIDDVAREIGMDPEELEAVLKSDEFFNYMSDYDYSRPIGHYTMVTFGDPESN